MMSHSSRRLRPRVPCAPLRRRAEGLIVARMPTAARHRGCTLAPHAGCPAAASASRRRAPPPQSRAASADRPSPCPARVLRDTAAAVALSLLLVATPAARADVCKVGGPCTTTEEAPQSEFVKGARPPPTAPGTSRSSWRVRRGCSRNGGEGSARVAAAAMTATRRDSDAAPPRPQAWSSPAGATRTCMTRTGLTGARSHGPAAHVADGATSPRTRGSRPAQVLPAGVADQQDPRRRGNSGTVRPAFA